MFFPDLALGWHWGRDIMATGHKWFCCHLELGLPLWEDSPRAYPPQNQLQAAGWSMQDGSTPTGRWITVYSTGAGCWEQKCVILWCHLPPMCHGCWTLLQTRTHCRSGDNGLQWCQPRPCHMFAQKACHHQSHALPWACWQCGFCGGPVPCPQ